MDRQTKKGGILFLYLPDFSQKYWRPWNNRKHQHCFTPNIIQTFLTDKNMKNIFVTGVDLNNSFVCVCVKNIYSLLSCKIFCLLTLFTPEGV
jgi:hypothetical protein